MTSYDHVIANEVSVKQSRTKEAVMYGNEKKRVVILMRWKECGGIRYVAVRVFRCLPACGPR
jgi:hypothetical protein